MFADDLKLFLSMGTEADASSLQADIDAVYDWSVAHGLELNAEKCSVMTFGRKRVPFEYTYLVSGVPLKRVNTVTDLGVKFDPALNFHGHIRDIANASYRRLGFVLRNARPFREPTTARLLYTSLVRSKLEYFGDMVTA